MSTGATIRIGKATISIDVEGCISCGTRWSSGWVVVRRLTVRVGGREKEISLHSCAGCVRNKTPLLI